MSSTTFEATPGLARRVDDWLVSSGPTLAGRLNRLASGTGRWGLVLILLGLGLYKFTATEAQAIVPLVSNSPLMAWLYELGSVRAVSAGIGVVELVIAALLALHRWSPKAAAIGGLGGMVMFATTLSFLLTTPGALADPSLLGFLSKDLFLFAASALAASVSVRATVDRLRASR